MTEEQKQYNEEKTVFLTNSVWTSRHPHAKKMNLDPDLTPFTKINIKWITGQNARYKTIKLLKDNIGENLNDLVHDNDFLDTGAKAWSLKKIIDKLHFIRT